VRIRWIEVMRIQWFDHRFSLLATVAPYPHRAQAAQFSSSGTASVRRVIRNLSEKVQKDPIQDRRGHEYPDNEDRRR
jgi:hypothetical protein